MANAASAVFVGISGVVYHAPLSTAASAVPSAASGTPNAAFKAVGYVDDKGLTETPNTSTNKVKAWNGDIVRVIQTEHDVTYKFNMLETNAETAAMYFGNGTAASGVVNSTVLANEMYLFDVADGTKVERIYVPNGQVTDRGPRVFVNSDAVSYAMTVTAFPDASGNKAYRYAQ